MVPTLLLNLEIKSGLDSTPENLPLTTGKMRVAYLIVVEAR